jgi:hypothetical protein
MAEPVDAITAYIMVSFEKTVESGALIVRVAVAGPTPVGKA